MTNEHGAARAWSSGFSLASAATKEPTAEAQDVRKIVAPASAGMEAGQLLLRQQYLCRLEAGATFLSRPRRKNGVGKIRSSPARISSFILCVDYLGAFRATWQLKGIESYQGR